MGNSNTLAQSLIASIKEGNIATLLTKGRWKYASFIKKHTMIEEKIENIATAIAQEYDNKELAIIAKELLHQRNIINLPDSDDISWLSQIIQAMELESNANMLDINNYYILLSFLRTIPLNNSKTISKDILNLCKKYSKLFPEALLIPSKELKELLTTTTLFYPEMSPEHIVQAVCGTIKLSVRLAELAKNDMEWETNLRKELCQIHSLNIHICLLLEDAELLYFLDESESNSPKDVTTTIIQQITLEEVYRKYDGESAFFSKVSILLSNISNNVYYGKYSPIFTLCNYIEYSKHSFTSLFSLPLEYFMELCTLMPKIHTVQSFAELSLELTKANDCVQIFMNKRTNTTELSTKQKEELRYYLSLSTEELTQYKNTLATEEKNPTLFCTKEAGYSKYPEHSIIFNHIDSIIHEYVQEEKSVEIPTQYSENLNQMNIPKEYHNSLSLYIHMLEHNSIIDSFTIDTHGEHIKKIIKQSKEIFTIPIPIFYEISTDTITQKQTLQTLETLFEYFSTVISIAKEERLHICNVTQREYKETNIHENNALSSAKKELYVSEAILYMQHTKHLQ